jgi:hypothetical protein
MCLAVVIFAALKMMPWWLSCVPSCRMYSMGASH